MEDFFFTLATAHGGPGCVKITATDYETARNIMFEHYNNKWAFQYESLDDVHPLDQEILAVFIQ
jgi:hypothetical protein